MMERPILVYTTYTNDPGLSAAPLGIDEPLVYWYDGTEVAFKLPGYTYDDDVWVYYATERDAWIARERDCKREYRAVTPHPILMTIHEINQEIKDEGGGTVNIWDAHERLIDSWKVEP